MLVDGISLIEGSNITNLVVPAGTTFPASPDIGELFYKTGTGPGLYVYDGAWTLSGGSGIVTEADVEDGSILARVASNETITGTWAYNNPVTGANPTAAGHLTTKSYVDSEIDGIIAGSTNQVQFNAAGSFGASADLTFNDTSNVLRVGANLTNGTLVVSTGGLITNGLAGDSMGTTSMTIRPVITSSGNGSNVSIVGGDVSSGSNVSGSVFITGGGASSTGANSGLFGPNGGVVITGGPGSGSYPTGGHVTLTGGTGNYAAGWVTLSGGTGTGGGGGIALYTAPTTTQAERLRIANNGAWGLGGANYGTAGQVLTSAGSTAAPSWVSPVINTAITLTTAAQPNVTSVGTLTSLAVTGDISAGGNITAAEPTLGSQVTTKSYVDNLVNGLSWKTSVRVATTANITLSGTQTIDSTALVVGDRVLVKNQTVPAQNGVYVVAAGTWARAADFDASPSAGEVNGTAVFVREGIVAADTAWTQTATVVVIGTDPMTFTIFSATGGAVAKTGDTMTGQLSIESTGATAQLNLRRTTEVGGYSWLRLARTDNTRALELITISDTPAYGIPANAVGINAQGPNGLHFSTADTLRMSINGSGNVGIGKVPTVRLDVQGVSQFYSGSTGTFNHLNVGRTISEARVAVAANAGDFLNNMVAGDVAFYNVNSTNTYVGTAGAGSLILTTNNTNRVLITSSGNVGINQASPQSALSFANAATITWGSTNFPYITGDQTSDTLVFGTQATERVRIDSSGGVRINRTSAISGIGEKLSVQTNDTGFTMFSQQLNNSGYNLGIQGQQNIMFYGTSAVVGSVFNDNSTLSLSANNGLNFVVGGANRTRIDSNGKVLIATISSPPSNSALQLLVAGSSAIGVQPSGNGAVANFISHGVGATMAANWWYDTVAVTDKAAAAGHSPYYVMNQSDGAHVWYVTAALAANATRVATEAMRINAAGNVGIGTIDLATASPRLAVNGNIRLPDLGQLNSTGSLVFGTGGANERMRITSAGEVLIGSTTRDFEGQLYVKTASGIASVDVFTASSAEAKIQLLNNNNSSAIGCGAGGALVFYANTRTTERMRLDSNGNLGIGGVPNSNGAGWATFTANGSSGGAIEFNAGGVRYGQLLGNTSEVRLSAIGTTQVINFQTNGVNSRMAIAASGQIGMGGNTNGIAGGASHILAIQYAGGNTQYGLALRSMINTTTAIDFVNASDAIIGNVTTGVSTVAYNTSSDARLKMNIVDAPSAVEKVKAMKVRSFDWIVDGASVEHGFIAQELNEVEPLAVTTGDTWAIDPSKLVATLTKALQEALTEIDSLKARVAALEM